MSQSSKRIFPARQHCFASAVSLCVLVAAGCGVQSGGIVSTSTVPILSSGRASLSGSVHGGQNPVAGSTIQLYAVGSSGYASAAKALIASSAQVVYNPAAPAGTTGALTDSNGDFDISGDFSCPAGSYVYITGSGGNAGGGTNPNIALMAALGPCSQLSSSTFILVNEVTTVAGAYALAQFSSGSNFGTALSSQPGSGSSAPSDNFSTSSTNLQGIANAMATAAVIAGNSTGTSPGGNTNGTATPDYWQVNMIADILAACVNTASPFTSCNTLYSTVNPVGGKAPADTLQASVAMALSPSLTNCASSATCGSTQIGTLYGLIAGTGVPFQPYPVTATQVNDLTIGISYNPVVPGGAASTVGSLTLSANPGGVGCSSPTVAFSGGGGSGAAAVAAVGTGATASNIVAVGVTNPGSGYTSAPSATISGCTTAPAITVNMAAPTLLFNYADSVTVDAYGNVWVGTQTHAPASGILPAAFVELDPTGNPIPNTPSPTNTASSYQITSYSLGGTSTTIFGQYSGSNLWGVFRGAFDTNNNFWFLDSASSSNYASGSRGNLVGFPGSGPAYTSSGYSSNLYNGASAGAYGYSMNDKRPVALTIDGNNDIWVEALGGTFVANNPDASTSVSSLGSIADNGLYGIFGVTTPSATAVAAGSPGTSVVFGGVNSDFAFSLVVDPNVNDKANGTQIPGSPFVWSIDEGGLYPGAGTATDGGTDTTNLLDAGQGALFPYYTAASGVDYAGATVAVGSYTPLAHNDDPNGVLTSNGISSTAGGFVPTVSLGAGNGCTTQPTIGVTMSGSSVGSLTLVSGGAGCTTSGALVFTSAGDDVTPTTAATGTYTVSSGAVTAVALTQGGAAYGSIATTPIGGTAGGTLTTKGGTTGTGFTSNVSFNSSDYFDFPMASPYSGVFDSQGNLWIANGASVDSTSSLGNPAYNVKASSSGTTGSMTKLNIDYGSAFTPAQFETSTTYNLYHDIAGLNSSGLDANHPTFTAIDGGNNVYFNIYAPGATAKDTSGSSVGGLSSTGTALSPTAPASGFQVAGFSGSCYWQSTVVNGTGTSCLYGPANTDQQSPYHRNFRRAYYGVAVDGSGNIWYATAVDNSQTSTITGGGVVEIVGAAVPVVTPTSVSLKNGTYGTKP